MRGLASLRVETGLLILLLLAPLAIIATLQFPPGMALVVGWRIRLG